MFGYSWGVTVTGALCMTPFLFLAWGRTWLRPACRCGSARGSTGRGPAGAGRFSSFRPQGRDAGSVEAGCEDGDLRFPGEGLLGGGGVPEFRAGLLLAFGVPLPAGDVEGAQGGAGGGVGRGGDRLQ